MSGPALARRSRPPFVVDKQTSKEATAAGPLRTLYGNIFLARGPREDHRQGREAEDPGPVRWISTQAAPIRQGRPPSPHPGPAHDPDGQHGRGDLTTEHAATCPGMSPANTATRAGWDARTATADGESRPRQRLPREDLTAPRRGSAADGERVRAPATGSARLLDETERTAVILFCLA